MICKVYFRHLKLLINILKLFSTDRKEEATSCKDVDKDHYCCQISSAWLVSDLAILLAKFEYSTNGQEVIPFIDNTLSCLWDLTFSDDFEEIGKFLPINEFICDLLHLSNEIPSNCQGETLIFSQRMIEMTLGIISNILTKRSVLDTILCREASQSCIVGCIESLFWKTDNLNALVQIVRCFVISITYFNEKIVFGHLNNRLPDILEFSLELIGVSSDEQLICTLSDLTSTILSKNFFLVPRDELTNQMEKSVIQVIKKVIRGNQIPCYIKNILRMYENFLYVGYTDIAIENIYLFIELIINIEDDASKLQLVVILYLIFSENEIKDEYKKVLSELVSLNDNASVLTDKMVNNDRCKLKIINNPKLFEELILLRSDCTRRVEIESIIYFFRHKKCTPGFEECIKMIENFQD